MSEGSRAASRALVAPIGAALGGSLNRSANWRSALIRRTAAPCRSSASGANWRQPHFRFSVADSIDTRPLRLRRPELQPSPHFGRVADPATTFVVPHQIGHVFGR